MPKWMRSKVWMALLLLAACTAALPVASRRVTLVVDGQNHALETQATTVRDVLQEMEITLGALDRVRPVEIAFVTDGMTITVVRVIETTEVFSRTVPFERQIARDASLPEGESRLLQAGQAGVMTEVYRVILEDGIETERTLIEERLSTPPRDEIRLLGTRPRLQRVDIEGVLAYLSNQDAWIIRGSNLERRRLTNLGDLDGRVFSLSPDGSRLLFTRPGSDPETINELWLINTVQAAAEPVRLDIQDVLWADWSPEGRRLAWSTGEFIPRPPGWRGQNDLWTAAISDANALTSRRQVLSPEAGGGYGWWGTRYVWSPNGTQLAYSRPESIGVVSLTTPRLEPLATFPGLRTYSSWTWNPHLSWSPAGDFILSTIHKPSPAHEDPEESPVFDLYILAASGTLSVSLANEVGMWAAPSFSPDGETILYGRAIVPYQSESSPYRICLQDRDGSNARCMYPTDPLSGLTIPEWIWAPGGDSIALINYGDVYLLDPVSGVAQPLTDQGNTTRLQWR